MVEGVIHFVWSLSVCSYVIQKIMNNQWRKWSYEFMQNVILLQTVSMLKLSMLIGCSKSQDYF